MLATTSTTLWFTMRATGIVALILLTGTMVLGIMTAGRVRSRSLPAFAHADLHKRVSLLAMVFLALHVVTAVLDTFVHVGWMALIVPFASPYRPLWTGLGTVGVDLMLAVAVSSALRQRISARTWRGIHWLAYGSWPVAMAHSLGMGTDASKLWMDGLAAACTVAVLWAGIWRLTDERRNRARAALLGAATAATRVGAALQPPVGPLPTRTTAPPTATATRLLERERR